MSYTELHTGKLHKYKNIGQTINEYCISFFNKYFDKLNKPKYKPYKDVTKEQLIELLKNNTINDYVSFLHDYNCIYYKDNIYYITNHYQTDEIDYLNHSVKKYNSIDFVSIFYNGGTCLTEMLQELIDKNNNF